MSKDDYQDVPVLMSGGQVFSRFGFKGMPLFTFAIETPGDYTLSAVYTGETEGPRAQVIVFPQAVQNIKQTLIVGVGGFVVFLAIGIFLLWRARHPAPPAG